MLRISKLGALNKLCIPWHCVYPEPTVIEIYNIGGSSGIVDNHCYAVQPEDTGAVGMQQFIEVLKSLQTPALTKAISLPSQILTINGEGNIEIFPQQFIDVATEKSWCGQMTLLHFRRRLEEAGQIYSRGRQLMRFATTSNPGMKCQIDKPRSACCF